MLRVAFVLNFHKKKPFHKVIVSLEIFSKWSVLLQLYWNKSASPEIRRDERITHTVCLSNSVLLQAPGMKMDVPYVISRLKHGWWIQRSVSRLKKKNSPKLNQHWNTVGSNWMDWNGLCFGWQFWGGRFVFQGTVRPQRSLSLVRQVQPLTPVEEVVAGILPFGNMQIKLPVLGGGSI